MSENKKIDKSKIKFKALSNCDIDEVLEIQKEAFDVMTDKTILRQNTKETFLPCFDFPNKTLGVFYKNELIAFGMLLIAGEDRENLLYSMDDFNAAKLQTTANIKVIIVRPKYRGNGLQKKLINSLEQYAKENGIEQLFATVAPNNFVSLKNFVECGFENIKTTKKYGGLTRFLLRKVLI